MALREGSIAKRLSTFFRMARDRRLRLLIDRLAQGRSAVRILDMGGAIDYWRRVGLEFLKSRNCRITLVNLDAQELTLSEREAELFVSRIGNACDLSDLADDSFDLTHSNSVVEHLGTWTAMKKFAAEARRLAPSYYVQTPNFWFPIDPHYYRFPLFHWLPRPTRATLFKRFKVAQGGRAESWDKAFDLIDASRLLNRRQMLTLFPDAQLSSERVIGLAKSLVALRERAPGGPLG